MPIHFDKAEKRWRFSFNRIIAGQRHRATKLLPVGWSKAKAQEYEQKETARLFSLANGKSSHRRTIEEAIEIYCSERLPELKSGENQLREYAQCYWVYEGKFIDELPEVVATYRKESGLSPATIKIRMAYVRSACRYAYKFHKFCDHDPAERVNMPTVNNARQVYASRKEVLQIARAIKWRSIRAAFLIAFYSGMRLAEILRADIKDGMFQLKDTKNGDPRTIPIHYRLAWCVKHMPIQPARSTVQQHIKRAMLVCGHTDLHFHDMRHSAASEMINADVDLYTVGGVLGHKSAQSTKRYSHLATATLALAVAKIGRKKI
jgi:integrase